MYCQLSVGDTQREVSWDSPWQTSHLLGIFPASSPSSSLLTPSVLYRKAMNLSVSNSSSPCDANCCLRVSSLGIRELGFNSQTRTPVILGPKLLFYSKDFKLDHLHRSFNVATRTLSGKFYRSCARLFIYDSVCVCSYTWYTHNIHHWNRDRSKRSRNQWLMCKIS